MYYNTSPKIYIQRLHLLLYRLLHSCKKKSRKLKVCFNFLKTSVQT